MKIKIYVFPVIPDNSHSILYLVLSVVSYEITF